VRRREFIVSVAALAFCLSTPVQGQQPDIPENIKQFWAKLAKAKTLTFMAQIWDWEIDRQIAPKPYMRLASTCEVKIQKPNRLVVWASPALEYEPPPENGRPVGRSIVGAIDNIQISDGKRSLLLNTFLRTYKHETPLKALDQPAEGLAVRLSFDFLFDKDPMQGFVPLPAARPRVNLGPTYILPSPDPKKPWEVRMVFDKNTGQLAIISTWGMSKKGEMEEGDRLIFYHWDFDPPLPRATFDTRPPRGYQTYAELEKELKARQSGGK
jgi:hypothetical protein